MEKQRIGITTDYIRLDAALKLSGCVETGGQAKVVIQAGLVRVNGEVCTMRGKKLRECDSFTFEGNSFEVKKNEG